MNRFEDNKNRKIKPAGIIIAVLIVFVLVFSISAFTNSQYLDDKTILEEAIYKDIIHCYSVEGYYPKDVEYMEEHYGLRYDKNKYHIEYIYIGGSVRPDYKVVTK